MQYGYNRALDSRPEIKKCTDLHIMPLGVLSSCPRVFLYVYFLVWATVEDGVGTCLTKAELQDAVLLNLYPLLPKMRWRPCRLPALAYPFSRPYLKVVTSTQ